MNAPPTSTIVTTPIHCAKTLWARFTVHASLGSMETTNIVQVRIRLHSIGHSVVFCMHSLSFPLMLSSASDKRAYILRRLVTVLGGIGASLKVKFYTQDMHPS